MAHHYSVSLRETRKNAVWLHLRVSVPQPNVVICTAICESFRRLRKFFLTLTPALTLTLSFGCGQRLCCVRCGGVIQNNRVLPRRFRERISLRSLGLCPGVLYGFVNGLFSPAAISFPAEFALGRESASALFARTWFSPGEFLPFAGEARLGHAHASATGAFRTTLTAVSFSFVCISFTGPLVLNHCATGAGRKRS